MPNKQYTRWQDRLDQRNSDLQRNRGASATEVTVTNNQWGSINAMGNHMMDAQMFANSFQMIYGTAGDGKSLTEDEKNATALQIMDKIKVSAQSFEGKENALLSSEANKYRELGMIRIAENLENKAIKAWKELEISLAGYKRINAEELEIFRAELRKIGDMKSKRELIETSLHDYMGQNLDQGSEITDSEIGLPPAEILEKLKVAKDSKLFDAFSILHIKYVPDPILCGRIEESQDLYFIAEWGDDVKLTDIVK